MKPGNAQPQFYEDQITPYISAKSRTETVLTGIHVDDSYLLLVSLFQAANFKQQIASIWEISDLREAKFCVGITIKPDLVNHHICLSKPPLIDKIPASFNMIDCNPVLTPMEAGLVLSRQEEIKLLDLPYRRLLGFSCILQLPHDLTSPLPSKS